MKAAFQKRVFLLNSLHQTDFLPKKFFYVDKKEPFGDAQGNLKERKILELSLEGISPHTGIVFDQLPNDQKRVFKNFIDLWKNRSVKKEYLNLEELSNCLKQPPEKLENLFYYLQIYPREGEYASETVDWLIDSFMSEIEHRPKMTSRPSAMRVWLGMENGTAYENRFQSGEQIRSSWNLEDLSLFLAIPVENMGYFLKLNNVYSDAKQEYSAKNITRALQNSSNERINTILELNRTQSGSLRWS